MKRLDQDGIAVTLPDNYDLVPAVPGAPPTSKRGRAAAGLPPTPDQSVVGMMLNALEQQGLQRTALTLQHTPTSPASTTRGGGTVSEPQEASFEVPLAPGQAAVVLIEEDGYFTWRTAETVEVARATRGLGPSTDRDRIARFTVNLGVRDAPTGRRFPGGDFIRKVVADKVTAHVLKFVARFVASNAIQILERKVKPGLVFIHQSGTTPAALHDPAQWQTYRPGEPTPPLQAGGKVLLLLHGTFSSTRGSFGGLCLTEHGRAFLTEAAKQYQLILGYDHRTLSEDPAENAADLRDALAALFGGEGSAVIDAISYSRGVLVLRTLIDMMATESPRVATFGQAILVGGTNGGTRLAEPANWKRLIDVYTNLTMGAGKLLGLVAPGAAPIATVIQGMLSGVGSFAKFLALEAVSRGGVPGLAAMEPDGDFIKDINQPRAGDVHPATFFAVTSDFEPSFDDIELQLPKRLLREVADFLVDDLMRTDNDWVVDTGSMTAIENALPGCLNQVLELGTNSRVYHLVYFVQPEVVKAFEQWLLPNVVAQPMTRSLGVAGFQWSPMSATYRPGRTLDTTPRRSLRASETPELRFDVTWGAIENVEAHVYAVGHYQNVLPSRAELALDRKISGAGDLVLTQLTRSGALSGGVGDLSFYPIAKNPGQMVVVCGMGSPGSFGLPQLKQLARKLVWSLNLLPDDRELCMVLIGSGEGSLRTKECVHAFLDAFAEPVIAGRSNRVTKVTIAERLRNKAEEVLEVLQERRKVLEDKHGVRLLLPDAVTVGRAGVFTDPHQLAMVITAATQALRQERVGEAQALDHILAYVPKEYAVTDGIKDALGRLYSSDFDFGRFSRTIEVIVGSMGRDKQSATRVSWTLDRASRVFRAAAITNISTVAERVIDVDPELVTEASGYMSGAKRAELPRHSTMLYKLIVPDDFRSILSSAPGPITFELDRNTASIHWEMLAGSKDPSEPSAQQLGLLRPISRQLRTVYSAAPSVVRPARDTLRALVIGDPGDPSRGDNLRGARREAIEVYQLLKKANIQVELLLGPPARNEPDPSYAKLASRFEVLRHLVEGHYDIVHYCGHGNFDPLIPSDTGWVFADGMLRAAEIRRVDAPPSLVFANACLSAQHSKTAGNGPLTKMRNPRAEAALVASLADEFLARGVRNYIGTAWEVDDEAAVAFSRAFYEEFAPARRSGAQPIGEALLKARVLLSEQRDDCLWGAYQHYGDPAFCIADLEP